MRGVGLTRPLYVEVEVDFDQKLRELLQNLVGKPVNVENLAAFSAEIREVNASGYRNHLPKALRPFSDADRDMDITQDLALNGAERFPHFSSKANDEIDENDEDLMISEGEEDVGKEEMSEGEEDADEEEMSEHEPENLTRSRPSTSGSEEQDDDILDSQPNALVSVLESLSNNDFAAALESTTPRDEAYTDLMRNISALKENLLERLQGDARSVDFDGNDGSYPAGDDATSDFDRDSCWGKADYENVIYYKHDSIEQLAAFLGQSSRGAHAFISRNDFSICKTSACQSCRDEQEDATVDSVFLTFKECRQVVKNGMLLFGGACTNCYINGAGDGAGCSFWRHHNETEVGDEVKEEEAEFDDVIMAG